MTEAVILLGNDEETRTEAYAGIAETDSTGAFRVSTEFPVSWLTVNRLGYLPLRVEVEAGRNSYSLMMEPDGERVLDEVVVKGYKQAVKLKAGGLEYNMTHSPVQDGNVLDAMRFIPMLHVEQERVNIIGKSSVKYYVNGRELKLTGEALTAYIQALPTGSIERVEVITAQDPRFDMGRDEGVIHIITRKNENEGWKGVATARVWKTHYLKESGNVLMTYNGKKLAADFFVNVQNTSDWKDSEVLSDYRETGVTTLRNSLSEGNSLSLGFQSNVTYTIDSRSSLRGRLNLSGYDSKNEERGGVNFTETRGGTPYAYIVHDNENRADQRRASAGVDYMNNFGNPQYLLYATADYYHGYVKSTLTQKMDSVLYGTTRPHDHYEEVIPQKADVWSGQLYYNMPAGRGNTFTTALDGYYSKIDNDDRFRTPTGSGFEDDPLRSRHLKVDEWRAQWWFALYRQWNTRLTTNAGIGIARRVYSSRRLETDEKAEQRFWQPTPYVTVSYVPDNNCGLTYNLTYYTVNPSFEQMNGFRYYTSATTCWTGNPDLSQEKVLSQSLTVQFLQRFSVNLQHTYRNDGVENYNRVTENNLIETRPENMAQRHSASFYVNVSNLSYAKNRGSLSLSGGLAREWYHADMPDQSSYNRVSDRFWWQVNHFLMLSRKHRFQMINSLNYYSKQTSGFTVIPVFGNFSTSLQKRWKQWSVEADVRVYYNIYDSGLHLKSQRIYDAPELYYTSTTKGECVSFGLKVTYSFGKSGVKDVKKGNASNSDVRSRLQ